MFDFRSCLGGLAAAAALTASSVALADVPDTTWSALRDREIILETQGGKRLGGKLIDVQSSSVAVLLPNGDTLMIDRGSVRSVRAAGDEKLPSYRPPVQGTPRILEWQPGDTIPPGYEKKTQMRTGLVVAGSVMLGTAYVASAITAGFGTPLLAIPVAGPFITAGTLYSAGSMNRVFAIIFVFDGIQQTAGLTMLIVGLAAPKTFLLRTEDGAAKRWWTPTPMSFGAGSFGMGIKGTM